MSLLTKKVDISEIIQNVGVSFVTAMAVFIALNIHGYDYTFYRQCIVLFLLLALIMAKLFYSYKNNLVLPNSPVILLYGAFLSWLALSALWSAVAGESFLVSLTFLVGLLAMILGFWANDKQWLYFRFLLIPIALAVVALTSYQAFVLKIERPSGFLLNWNTNSAFLGAIAVPYCVDYLRQISEKQKMSWLTGLFIACCTFGMTLGQGRASLAVLVLAVIALFVISRKQQNTYRTIGLTLFWVIGGVVLGDVLHGGFLVHRFMDSAQTAASLNNVSSLGSGREYLWSAGWKMYLDKPILGWGIGVFRWLYPQYHDPLHIEDGNYTHNDYLQFLIELGPIGLILCLSWVSALFVTALRLLKATSESQQRFDYLGISLACAAMLLHTAVDFHLYHVPMLILLGAYSGRLSGQYQQWSAKQTIVKFQDISGTARGYFGILTAISLFMSVGLLNIGTSFLAMQQAYTTDKPLEQFHLLDKAQRFLPFVELFQVRPAWLILELIESQPEALPEKERDFLVRYGLGIIEQAIINNPLSSFNHQYRAKFLLLLKGNSADITREFEKSLALNPYQLNVRLMLMRHFDSLKEVEKAKRVLAEGLNKSYIDGAYRVNEFYKQVDLHIEDSQALATPKKALKKEMDAMKNIHPNTTQIFTLPDIGWHP